MSEKHRSAGSRKANNRGTISGLAA